MNFAKLLGFACAGMLAAAIIIAPAAPVAAHGDVTPQLVDISGLEPTGTEWKAQNPYSGNARALEIGASGYNQNCARCHGLQVISGGLAPDLRYIDKGKPGDEWFVQRVRGGARKQDGTTIMPAFDGLLQQEAIWAIRTYVESLHQD
jgi:cytochrome c-550 PedF